MAITRATAKNSKTSIKMNSDSVTRVKINKMKKSSSKAAKLQPKIKSLHIAAKVQ